jgi:magnesium transporter
MIRGLGMYSPTEAFDILDVEVGAGRDQGAIADMLRGARDRAADIPEAFVWVGLFEPSRAELQTVAAAFDLDHLLVEDAANSSQRPKFELDDSGHGLVIVKVLDYVETTSDVNTGQVAIFVGSNYVITVRFGSTEDLRAIRARIQGSPNLRSTGPIGVLYAILDSVVDGYVAVSDEVSADIENLESQVFSVATSMSSVDQIYRLKRENVEIRRATNPLTPFAQHLASRLVPWVPKELDAYFRDIGDHILRVSDTVESADNLLMTLLMASTSLQDLQQNQDMRKISGWVAIAAVPTMIAGIYGMNFDTMPELHQAWGYPAVLLLMAGSCFAMYRAFKRSGWL